MCSIIHRAVVALLVGIATVAPPIVSADAQTSPIVGVMPVGPYADYIAAASRRFGIPAAWIRAVMRAESANDPHVVSRKGAIGLMQMMPATWANLRVRHRLGTDPYDPRDNILAGTAYLRELYDRYGSVAATLAAYNAGPGRYEASLAGRLLPIETRAYVAALAPILGGEIAPEAPSPASAPPLDWRDAPLFIARQNDSRVAAAQPSAAQSGILFAAASGQDRR